MFTVLVHQIFCLYEIFHYKTWGVQKVFGSTLSFGAKNKEQESKKKDTLGEKENQHGET